MFNTAGGYDAAYFAVLPRREQRPAALILPALELRRVETKSTWVPNIFGHSGPGENETFPDSTPKGLVIPGLGNRAGVSQTGNARAILQAGVRIQGSHH